MFRFTPKKGNNTLSNRNNGTEPSRVRETEHVPFRFPVPFLPLSVPNCVLRMLRRLATGWPLASAWWVLQYELAEGAPC
jgi:hypothetical protein